MSITRPGLVTFALLTGTFLAALDSYVVSTAMPTVVGQLGGLHLYGWVFSAYLLASTSTLPLYGGLADTLGRKPVYLAATALFLLGSALCGTAPSMIWLIVFRALQGLGAGGLIPITLTLFGDLYQAERRAFVQGLFSTVWGVSSVLGPLIGGFFVTYVSWRWAFWINLPIGLVAAAILWASLQERVPPRPDKLDLLGALLLTAGLVLLLLGLQAAHSPGQGQRALLYTLTALALASALLPVELRARRPVLPFALFRHRVLLVSCAAGLGLGTLLFVTIAFIPLFLQGVRACSPTQAGLALVPMSVTWTAATFFTGALCRRAGYRPVVLVAGMLALAGPAALLVQPAGPTLLSLHLGMVAIGAAMGLSITPMTIAVQDAVTWDQRGAATSLLAFPRAVGGMAAVTLLGLAVTSRYTRALPPAVLASLKPEELLEGSRVSSLPPQVRALARAAMGRALRVAFWAMLAAGAVILLLAMVFPALRMAPRED